jgi:DNA adenine methylase
MPYFGSKATLAERIVALLPPHRSYVEPYAGSLAVLLAKPPTPMETVNDLDGHRPSHPA